MVGVFNRMANIRNGLILSMLNTCGHGRKLADMRGQPVTVKQLSSLERPPYNNYDIKEFSWYILSRASMIDCSAFVTTG
jgi:hypothetical protein